MTMPGTPDIPGLPPFDPPDLPPALSFAALRAEIPFLLLPVRLETRFYHAPERLRIRIYPDQIHVDSHQAALSDVEAQLGGQFWGDIWWAGWDKASRSFARLAEVLGVWRAAWVVDATAPVNLDRMGKDKPIFPPPHPGWDPSAPARLALLPDRWFAVGIQRGETVFVEYGAPITETLRFAPFQMQSGGDVERWMVDFDLARQMGMALEINLHGSKAAIATEGLDELIVLGARIDEPEALAQQLEAALQAHFYTRGFDFVPQGTPTNNTESVRSPWQWNTADSSDLFRRRWQPTPAHAGSFRQRFAQALGLDGDGVVARAAHGDLADVPSMEAMNQALWYTTWGEYLRFVLHDGEQAPLADASIDWLRDWFIRHVRGGAVYPAFQIGSMPYGLLPIQIEPVPKTATTNNQHLQTVLWNLRAGWERSLPNVPHLDPTATASATDAEVTTDLEAANDNLIALLSSNPHPVRFFTRHLYSLRNPAFDLDILIGLGLIVDPVDRLWAHTVFLLDDMLAVDGVWAYVTSREIDDGFDSLADQTAYFQNLLDGLDARMADLQAQINELAETRPLPMDVREAIQALEAQRDLVDDGIRNTLSLVMDLLHSHAARVGPINEVGLPPLVDVVGEETPNPEHFYYLYKDLVTEWGDLPLVQAADATGGATAAEYLAWLHDYVTGSASGTGPDGLPDPAPLLFQLIKRAIDRAHEWDHEPLYEFDRFLVDLQQNSQLGSVAAQVNGTRRLASNSRRLSNIAGLLNRALDSPPGDATHRAIAGVPRSVFGAASAHLREYQRITRQASPELAATIEALNEWARVPSGTAPPRGAGTTTYVPVPGGDRAATLAHSISHLAGLAPEELELRLTETLGLATHRLDAWITAYAEQQVDALRSKNPTGIQIGGYGWVENLRPDTAGALPSQGYIHAPSMTHAAAAAVLRSGYSAYSDGTGTSPLSVDLRSDRVRVASWIMDGVRQGERINDLLGYRFERFLHDHHLDIWITPVREVVAAHGTTELAGSSSVVTVDGLALLELWDEGAGALENLVEIPQDEDGTIVHTFDEIIPALEHLVWVTDAMADLALAESVHALVQGDYERASAVQNAAALGDVPPPEVRSILTPNSGMTITHRIVLMPQGTGSAWKAADESVRSRIEPELEAWASAITGAPDRVLYRVRGGSGDPVETRSLAGLPLSALDAVYLAPAGANVTGSGLGALLARDYRQRHATGEHDIPDITIDPDVPVGDGQISLAEFLLLANSVRQTLSGARPAARGDFLLGASEAGDEAGAASAGELAQRAMNLVRNFSAAIREVARGTAPLEPALLRLSYFNLPQAIPATDRGGALAAQAQMVLTAANARLEQVNAAVEKLAQGDGNAPSAGQMVRLARDIIAAILGRDYPVMLRFELPLPADAFRDEMQVASSDPRAVMGWLLKMARVRPELIALRDTITAAEAFQDRSLFPFWVAQDPAVTGEPWAGLARPNTEGSDRLSLVLTTNGSFPGQSSAACGLVIDQWIERIPTDYEMTGLTFHFDAPTSRPPQVLLLAVPPAGSAWDFDLALETVREAFALARLRAVAPETLAGYGHHLPAVYLTSNLDTIGASNDV
jgi:hypothetical protein